MDRILELFSSENLVEMASDPRVLFGTGVVFVLAVLFRWKYVLLFLFAVGATLTVVRYTGGAGSAETIVDRNLMMFVGGTLVIAVVLIYFLFIRGD